MKARLSYSRQHFQEKVDDLLVIEEEIDIDVRSLETSAYSANTYSDIPKKIQKAVDTLSLHAYSNLQACVANLDESVETKFAGRLKAGIRFVVILCLLLPCIMFNRLYVPFFCFDDIQSSVFRT